ncbi:hypothetical protein DFR40_2663 [Azonexus fungiphilus]|uniref:Uncharacterized protein n=2 Tax=Azonexus fungiphilus TaxID=146940 RepID=A0A495VMY1_9RHOO|nr:hypothetical protein DFR40_2663 [Azonexus fungiphilus]
MVSSEFVVALADIVDDTKYVKSIRDACLYLRDDLLQTTGQRIWGLTFTLHPDGKFNIEYDYEKPEDYDDSDDAISLAQAQASLAGSGIPVSFENVGTSPEQQFLADALTRLQTWSAKHTAAWGLGTEAQWNLDMNAGQLRLSFADGREVDFPVQVVGTYNTRNGSFLWGWDHPSVPEPLRRAARQVRDYGEKHAIERFTTRTIDCSEADAWEITAAAAQLDDVTGAYRGDAGGTWVYMTFEVPDSEYPKGGVVI